MYCIKVTYKSIVNPDNTVTYYVGKIEKNIRYHTIQNRFITMDLSQMLNSGYKTLTRCRRGLNAFHLAIRDDKSINNRFTYYMEMIEY